MKQALTITGCLIFMFLNVLGHAVEIKPTNNTIAKQAFQLRLAGKTSQAKDLLDIYLKEHPDDASAQYEYSRTLGYLMDFETAEKHADLAVETAPDNSQYNCWQGICGTYLFIDQAHHKQNLDPAILARSIAAFEKAVELESDYSQARFMLVCLYNNNDPKHGGDKKKARLHAEKLMEIDTDYGLQAMMVINDSKSTDWKISQYQSALAKAPDNAGLHAGIASLYAGSNQIQTMQKHLDKAIELDKRKKDVLLEITFQLAMKKDFASAKEMTQRYLALATNEPAAMRAFALFYLAKIEKMSGDPNAENTLKKVRQIDPNAWMTMKAPPAMMFAPLD